MHRFGFCVWYLPWRANGVTRWLCHRVSLRYYKLQFASHSTKCYKPNHHQQFWKPNFWFQNFSNCQCFQRASSIVGKRLVPFEDTCSVCDWNLAESTTSLPPIYQALGKLWLIKSTVSSVDTINTCWSFHRTEFFQSSRFGRSALCFVFNLKKIEKREYLMKWAFLPLQNELPEQCFLMFIKQFVERFVKHCLMNSVYQLLLKGFYSNSFWRF